ncbi:hemoglobin subunit alpha-A-like [Lates japonicus]
MSLSGKDKAVVRAFWDKVGPKASDLGAEALGRMLTVYPQTKTYFSHWADVSADSAQVKKHGATIMAAVGEAVGKDDLVAAVMVAPCFFTCAESALTSAQCEK